MKEYILRTTNEDPTIPSLTPNKLWEQFVKLTVSKRGVGLLWAALDIQRQRDEADGEFYHEAKELHDQLWEIMHDDEFE